MLDVIFSPVVGIVVVVIIALLVALLYARSMYKIAGPDEAIIVSGRSPKTRNIDGVQTEESGLRVVRGAGTFIMPFFQRAGKLSLTSRAIEIRAEAQDTLGVTLTVDAVAIVKVGEKPDSIRAAAQRFLGQEKNIDNFAQEVLSGSLRASIGGTDVSTIIKERDKLGAAVLETARQSLANQGLDVDSFEIKGINDANGYIRDLGRAEQARVKQVAEISETRAKLESERERVTAEQAIAEANNTLALRRAELQLVSDRATAEAAAARPIAEARAQQQVVAEQELTARSRADLRRTELTSEVNAVADAAAYRVRTEAQASADRMQIEAAASRDARTTVAAALQKEAEAQSAARIAAAAAVRSEAEADRDARNLASEASIVEASAARDARLASAEATEREGAVEASAILARGTAEAETTRLKAAAVSEQSEALIQLSLIEALPNLARELAAPMSNIDSLTVVSTDGASALTKNVASNIEEVGAVLGFDIKAALAGLVSGAAAGRAVGNSIAGAAPEKVSGGTQA
jgi:flotillin